MFGPIIVGQTLRLEPPTREVYELYPRWESDTEVTRYWPMLLPRFRDPGERFNETAKNEYVVNWAIVVDGRPIGVTGLEGVDYQGRKSDTYTLIGERSAWGKGYASEASLPRTQFAFEQMNLQKLKTPIVAENVAMRRVAEKAGYRRCGLLRREHFRDGRWHDLRLGELLREEWEAARRDLAARPVDRTDARS